MLNSKLTVCGSVQAERITVLRNLSREIGAVVFTVTCPMFGPRCNLMHGFNRCTKRLHSVYIRGEQDQVRQPSQILAIPLSI